MASSIVLDRLLAAVFETLLLGAFLTLMLPCVRFLLHRKRVHDKTMMPMAVDTINIIVAVFLLFAVPTHWVLTTSMLTEGLVSAPEGPLAYFLWMQNPQDLVRTVLMMAITLCQNGLLLYRAYAVWRFRPLRVHLMLLFPLSLNITFLVCSLIFLLDTAGVQTHDAVSALDWFPIVDALALTENLVTTLIVSHRLLSTVKGMPSTAQDSKSARFAAILLWESSAMFCAFHLIALITYFAAPTVATVFIQLLAPVIGIAFCVLNIRICTPGLGSMDIV